MRAATMSQRNNNIIRAAPSSATGGSARNTSSRSRPSRLHLMSATGFTQEHKMSVFQRMYKFITLPKFSEYIMSVDHHQIWRRHLAWSLRDGDHLRNAVTSRFASNMVFMSLLLGTEIGVLFSPSQPADVFRAALKNESYSDANFWAAIMLCISIGFTLSTLVANFTAWAIIGAVSPQNSHAILRSSIGLDAAQLPARLVILSIYCFLVWVILFIYILVPHIWGIVIASFPVVLIAYIVIMYSSFGRLVIYSRAMQQKEIFKDEEDDNMSSKRLFEELLKLAEKEKHKKAPLPLYYRSKTELQRQLCALRSQSQDSDSGFESVHASHYLSQILSSSGHFDDKSLPGIADLETMEEEADEENSLPQSTNPDEGEDGMSSLRPRSGMRRGYSDPSSQASRLRGASSRSLLQNSPGASTMPMTLTG